MRKSLKNTIVLILCVQLGLQTTVYSQDDLSKADRYRLLDSLIQQRINVGEDGFKSVVEATESYFPDKNEIINDILVISDPDARNFLENYNEMFWRKLISDPETAEIYGEGKNLVTAIIRYYEITGQDNQVNWVKWAVGSAGTVIALGFIVTMAYRYVGLRNRVARNALSTAEKEFQQQFIKLSKEEKGLLQLYQGYHDDFNKAANSEEAINNMISFQKKRRDLIKTSLEHNIDENGNTLSAEERKKLENELTEVKRDIEDLKVKKRKIKSVILEVKDKIRGFNFGKWARRISAIALFFSIGDSMWAQSTSVEKQEAKNEQGLGIDRWFLNFIRMPHDLLHNSNYSSSEKKKFFLYLSLVYFIERGNHDGFVSDFFMGCLPEDYEPDPLRMQRSLVDILFVEEEYENFQDARLAMAAEMKTLTAKLSYEIQKQQSNDHCESSGN
ncbi:MAG TPA: hypothetical protein PKC21_03365 [Oligoflexia bacterium]|nr:hypothetical protein [Oligoflexia bacterium]HMR24374.1 hypothetical protein [Oligoflexia bacterium]